VPGRNNDKVCLGDGGLGSPLQSTASQLGVGEYGLPACHTPYVNEWNFPRTSEHVRDRPRHFLGPHAETPIFYPQIVLDTCKRL